MFVMNVIEIDVIIVQIYSNYSKELNNPGNFPW